MLSKEYENKELEPSFVNDLTRLSFFFSCGWNVSFLLVVFL